jgi:hypothetical protein
MKLRKPKVSITVSAVTENAKPSPVWAVPKPDFYETISDMMTDIQSYIAESGHRLLSYDNPKDRYFGFIAIGPHEKCSRYFAITADHLLKDLASRPVGDVYREAFKTSESRGLLALAMSPLIKRGSA